MAKLILLLTEMRLMLFARGRTFTALFLSIVCFLPASIHAEDGSSVVVLYNSNVPASKTVAEHYATARGVPASQIFSFALTTNEVMSRAEFTDSLQEHLAADLVEARLWKFGNVTIPADKVKKHTEKRVIASKIRYAVLCWGMPLKIAPDKSVPVLGDASESSAVSSRNEAAVDSELTWLPLIKTKVHLDGYIPNPFYGCTNPAALTPTNGILLVARLDGPTPEIANGLVDKAMAAESNGLWGRAYFDARGLQPDNPYYGGDEWILDAAKICRYKGFDVDIDTNSDTFSASYPLSQIAIYAGWYDWNASGPFTLPTVEFMPGAFAYHLHSFSADTLRSTTQNWCGPLLAKGATCTMGCVYEPYLEFTPNIAFFMDTFLSGYSFGEAAWACQRALSWQSTVIGDPLYRPINKSPAALYAQLAHEHNPLLEWSWNQILNLDLIHGLRASALAHIMENVAITGQSAVLTEKMAELDESAGKTESAIDAWQKALTLHPTPQQRIRIRRTLAQKLVAAGRPADAIKDWEALIAEEPNYAGIPMVRQKLQELGVTNAPPPTVAH